MNEETLLNADIPEKFKDPATGEVRLNDFAKSYRELEKQFSSRPLAPQTADDYAIECKHGLFQPDQEVNQRLHAKGITQDQAQEIYDLAAEKMMPIIREVMADIKAEREVEKLINHFGGAESWKMISKQLLAFGQQHLPADVLANLSSSYEGVLALHRLMKSEEPMIPTENAMNAQPNTAEKDLQSMMKDPKYWRDKDPAFVQKVTDGFKTMYGE